MKIHIKCSEFGWVKNVPDGRSGGIPFYRVGIEHIWHISFKYCKVEEEEFEEEKVEEEVALQSHQGNQSRC